MGVAVGAAYAQFDARDAPGLVLGGTVLLAAFTAGLGINLMDDVWDGIDLPGRSKAAFVLFAVAAGCGLAIVPFASASVWGYGLAAVGLGLFRRAPAVGFDTLGGGLGDLATGIALGPLAVLVGFAACAGGGSAGAALAGIPVGLIAVAATFGRHFARRNADARAERNTPVAALGDATARRLLVLLPLVAAAAVGLAAGLEEFPAWATIAAAPQLVTAAAAWRVPESIAGAESFERTAAMCAVASLVAIAAALSFVTPV